MSIDTDHDTDQDTATDIEVIGEPVAAPDQVVEVRRRAGLSAGLGAGASLMAVAYLARAVDGGSILDWVLAVVLGTIGGVELAAFVDSRTPLLVADDLGVRLRLGRTWVGLPWAGLQVLEHRPRRGWRDGVLVARPTCVGRVLEDLDPPARRVARMHRRLLGAPLATSLGLSTRIVGAGDDLTDTLRSLADGRATVIAPEPAPEVRQEPLPVGTPVADVADVTDVTDPVGHETAAPPPLARHVPDPRPVVAAWITALASRFERIGHVDHEDTDDTDDTGAVAATETPMMPVVVVASATPEPARGIVVAARAEVRHESRAELGEDTQAWDSLEGESDVLDDIDVLDGPVDVLPDPVIGPELAGARERLGLTVDQLAERTRIRPHVIEALEIDDFSACGGDFYARGHLRTLARVLGLEVAPLLASYDERYADAPIDPRRVFEAELAGAGSIRATRGGPNWSVLVAAVMALVLCWSVARLVTGGRGPVEDHAVLSGSGGPNSLTTTSAKPVPVTLTATAGGARVTVRDGDNRLVFSGDLAFGQSHALKAAPPIRVHSTDGAVRVSVDGHDRGRMGPAGRPATQSYVLR
jgi:Helix-turn-helix domain